MTTATHYWTSEAPTGSGRYLVHLDGDDAPREAVVRGGWVRLFDRTRRTAEYEGMWSYLGPLEGDN